MISSLFWWRYKEPELYVEVNHPYTLFRMRKELGCLESEIDVVLFLSLSKREYVCWIQGRNRLPKPGLEQGGVTTTRLGY